MSSFSSAGTEEPTEALTPGITAADYDTAHRARQDSALLRELWAQAMGDQYPAEVDPFSACTWWLLGQIVARLRLPPNGRLVDLGCGCGGPGLWLARALSANLVGIDFSAVAVRFATGRIPEFVAPCRASFRQATFEDTGLSGGCADGVVSVDAFPFAADRLAALREVWRILVAGGRFVLTVRVESGGPSDWPAMARSVGFDVEDMLADDDRDRTWQRLYALWLAHEADLRADIGDHAAGNLILEARRAQQRLVALPRSVLLVLRRPASRSRCPGLPS